MKRTWMCESWSKGLAIVVLLGVQIPLAAQHVPSQTAQAYFTVQYTAETTMEMTVMGNPVKTVTTMRFQFAPPDKLRMETSSGGVQASVVISDGESIWSYLPLTKEYGRRSLKEGELPQQLKDFGRNVATQRPDSNVLRTETVEVDGQARECWVTENRTIPEMQGFGLQDLLVTTWIDKQNGLPVRSVMSGKMLENAGGGQMRTTTTLHHIQFDEPLDAELFQFVPPDGARENSALFPEPATEAPTAVADKPRPAFGPSEPQAFIPQMRPVTQVEPEYPAVTPPASLVEVSILVTVDPAGQVAGTEILSGNPAFRQAALDAVRHWKYRPVIRGGQPVYAYTEATVNFFGPENGAFTTEPMNLSEVDTSLQRTSALRAKFPRSVQQIFADLEQDAAVTTGMEREFALPELAKAATQAGAYDKAAAYANEMLKQDAKQPNYGQALHDGHIVLGLIALRQGNVAQAGKDLLESASTTGSATLGSFGPNMTLAKELLEKGESEVVIEYFSRCKTFWKMGQHQLEDWTAAVRAGRTPDFGANLFY